MNLPYRETPQVKRLVRLVQCDTHDLRGGAKLLEDALNDGFAITGQSSTEHRTVWTLVKELT